MNRIGLYFIFASISLLAFSCKFDFPGQSDPDLTGTSRIYPLFSGSPENYFGEVVFKQRVDGGTRILIELIGENSALNFPVHLHVGPAKVEEAAMAAVLNPINGESLSSITEFYDLADGTVITYDVLVEFDGHIRVHLGDSPEDRMVILAIGNIGRNYVEGEELSESDITICTTEMK